MKWAVFIGVLLMDTQTPREGSTATPGVPSLIPLVFAPYPNWSPFSSVKAVRKLFHGLSEGLTSNPHALQELVVDVASNSQHPTSTRNTLVYQTHCSASAVISVYFGLLCS